MKIRLPTSLPLHISRKWLDPNTNYIIKQHFKINSQFSIFYKNSSLAVQPTSLSVERVDQPGCLTTDFSDSRTLKLSNRLLGFSDSQTLRFSDSQILHRHRHGHSHHLIITIIIFNDITGLQVLMTSRHHDITNQRHHDITSLEGGRRHRRKPLNNHI